MENNLAALEKELEERQQDLQYEALQGDDSERSNTGKSICPPTDHQTENILSLLTGNSSVSVVTLVCLFLMWLHLFCGLSRIKVRMAREFITKILSLARESPLLDDSEYRRIPKDIRTTTKNLSVAPELDEKICCPLCFSLYTPSTAPWVCNYKQTIRARECGENLFNLKTLYRAISDKGQSQNCPSRLANLPPMEIGIPRNIYVTQKLGAWLTWFLKKENIEDEIDAWSQELKASTESKKIQDIQQSPAWKELSWPPDPPTLNNSNALTTEPLNLVFSLFIDWFNPRGNKQAGSQTSMGLLAYNCLNLPPSLRNLVGNVCVAGIIPGPNSPNMSTISHVLAGTVDELLLLEKGFTTRTRRWPNGRMVRVKLLPILGDVVGIHKAAGFASHSANLYCSFCWGKSDDLKEMRIGKLRTAEEVKHTSHLWKQAKTLNRKEEILKSTGVRWSEFNRLPYRDPVLDKPLGMMHNWLEGVLQHHFRFRWGFVVFSKEQKTKIKRKASEAGGEGPSKRLMYRAGEGNAIESEDDADGNDDDINQYCKEVGVDNGSGEGEEGDYGDAELGEGVGGGLFTEVDIDLFRSRMNDIVVPSGVSKMPKNLGESKHGSLRAAQWYSLFAFIIPLLILELYVDDVDKLNPE